MCHPKQHFFCILKSKTLSRKINYIFKVSTLVLGFFSMSFRKSLQKKANVWALTYFAIPVCKYLTAFLTYVKYKKFKFKLKSWLSDGCNLT